MSIIVTPAWQSLGEGQSVLVDMGPPPTTRAELRDRCAAVRVVAEMHELRWERVVSDPNLVFRLWKPTLDERMTEIYHRRALERQARDHFRLVTSARYRAARGTRSEAVARKGRDTRGRFLPWKTMQ
jgi:hypothetical protein